MPIFGKGGPKNPQELVKGLKDALSVLAQPGGGAKKAEKVNILLKFKTIFLISSLSIRQRKRLQNSFNK